MCKFFGKIDSQILQKTPLKKRITPGTINKIQSAKRRVEAIYTANGVHGSVSRDLQHRAASARVTALLIPSISRFIGILFKSAAPIIFVILVAGVFAAPPTGVLDD